MTNLKQIIPFLLISCFLNACQKHPPSDLSSPDFSKDPIWKEILEKVQQEYFEQPNVKKMTEGALNGMLAALDPYSSYMNQETYDLFKESTKGEFGGIGIEVLFLENSLRVITPMDDTPAARAGILAGDYIIKVDGELVTSFDHLTLLKKLHGKPGTKITLTLQRGDQDLFDVTLKRSVITINPVKFKREKNIGYIRISCFNEKTTEKLKEALDSMKAGQALQGVIIDLRDNPGGTLDQAVSVTSLFIDQGKIVEVRSRNSKKNRAYEANGYDRLKGIPLIVLINNGSASASEIMAGALKDHRRAIILGKTTLGKGSVQGVFPLRGQGAIKLTISRFYTPLGHEIQGKGITPDIIVEKNTQTPSLLHKEEISQLSQQEDQQLNRSLDMLNGMAFLKKH